MEVVLNSQNIKVNIIRKKIKNIYFRFDENMNLVVSANYYVKEKEIFNLIQKNQASLERMHQKIEVKREKKSKFWYLGNAYEIVIDENIKEVEWNDGVLTCKNDAMLNLFLKKQIKEIFIREVEILKKVIEPPNFTLKIRKMKTRWGVCNYKNKTITLNSELIQYNIEDLRYVIVHEMCHFWHHNHGKEFWNMVSVYYPNYKQARKDLKE